MDSLKQLHRQIVAHIVGEFVEGRRVGYPRIMNPRDELYVVIGFDAHELDDEECEALAHLLEGVEFETRSASRYRDGLVRQLRLHIS